MPSSLELIDNLLETLKQHTTNTNMSIFSGVKVIPPDAIFHVKTSHAQDKDPNKINLGIGAYRDDNGKPYVLKVVDKVEQELVNDKTRSKEYLGIEGDPEFIKLAQQLILGPNSKSIKNGTIAGVQSLSGTGALRVLMEFIYVCFGKNATILLSNPTWGNHQKVVNRAGLEYQMYRYWDNKTRGLDLNGMLEDLSKAKQGSWVLLHACAHNPTGVDPTLEQWGKICDVIQKNKLNVFFDTAYQGFSSGSLEKDAAAIRLFESRGVEFVVAQSFAKNMGLYGERVGCVSIVTNSKETANACQTQLEGVVRPMYSNPPRHGMEIVKKVLSNKENFSMWQKDLTLMSGRIIDMRKALRNNLEKLKTPGTWNHITDQIGMFSFTGLTPEQVKVITNKHHVYMLSNGRISMSGINTKNVERLAKAIDDVVRNVE